MTLGDRLETPSIITVYVRIVIGTYVKQYKHSPISQRQTLPS